MADSQIVENPAIFQAKPLHPLHQIAQTPTHKLLLKQWLKEQELILNRLSLKESQIDSARKEITHLYLFFFLFHSLSLILLFSASANYPGRASIWAPDPTRPENLVPGQWVSGSGRVSDSGPWSGRVSDLGTGSGRVSGWGTGSGLDSGRGGACRRSWIPSLCSLLCSLVVIWAVRYKSDVEEHVGKMLKREKEDMGLLGKCVEELKKKGVEFDLMKEVDALRRAKSLKIESGGGGVSKWNARDFVTLFFFFVSCLVLGLIRVILCG